MICILALIDSACLVDLEPIEDHRGSFARVYRLREFEDTGLGVKVFWSNLPQSTHRGVVRGFHCQRSPGREEVRALYRGSGVRRDRRHTPELETGVRFDDPTFSIPWPLPARDLTERDGNWPLLASRPEPG